MGIGRETIEVIGDGLTAWHGVLEDEERESEELGALNIPCANIYGK